MAHGREKEKPAEGRKVTGSYVTAVIFHSLIQSRQNAFVKTLGKVNPFVKTPNLDKWVLLCRLEEGGHRHCHRSSCVLLVPHSSSLVVAGVVVAEIEMPLPVLLVGSISTSLTFLVGEDCHLLSSFLVPHCSPSAVLR
jgi:hypothetical protein